MMMPALKFGYGALGVVNSILNVAGNLSCYLQPSLAPLRTSLARASTKLK